MKITKPKGRVSVDTETPPTDELIDVEYHSGALKRNVFFIKPYEILVDPKTGKDYDYSSVTHWKRAEQSFTIKMNRSELEDLVNIVEEVYIKGDGLYTFVMLRFLREGLNQ